MRGVHFGWLGVFTLALALPWPAYASNGTRIRTPVDWTGAACVVSVDRSSNAVVNIPYDIPYEDTDVTDDEVDDSRTFQFFALCRQHHPQSFLPFWISWDDVMRADARGLAPNGLVDEDVLETSSTWGECFAALNANNDRYPITKARASQGVNWDTTDVPAGPYMIAGYTWEPIENLWTERPGIVLVHDGGGAGSVAPGIAISTPEQQVFSNETVLLEGCITGDANTTVRGYWASLQGVGTANWEPQWVEFARDVDPDGTTLALPFPIPASAAGGNIMVRVDAIDGQGRRTEGYMRNFIVVLRGEAPGNCTEGSFVVTPGCTPTSAGSDAGDTGDASATDGQADAGSEVGESGSQEAGVGGEGPTQNDSGNEGSRGGGCHVPSVPPYGANGLLACVAWLAGRRRRLTSTITPAATNNAPTPVVHAGCSPKSVTPQSDASTSCT